MKQEQNSFRLWTYLRAYRLKVCLSIFLKILSVVWSVVEPFVLGLAITELTKKSHVWQKALQELVFRHPISRSLWRSIYSVGFSMSWDLIIPTISWPMLFKRPFRTCEMICSHKINHIPVSYFDRHQFGDLLDVLLVMSKPSLERLATVLLTNR